MEVVSLFDGVACAYVALKRAGIPVKSYTAYEVDKYASQVSKKNHPDLKACGDVKNLKEHIPCDLLIGGSPCTDLSVAKKERKGLDGDRSCLFWEYVRIKKLLNPKWFILENVASMRDEDKNTITKALGVEPIMIDASLVSAQRRKRYFWTNIPVELPQDREIKIKDILQDTVDEKYYIDSKKVEGKKGQGYRVYPTDGKSVTLCSNGGGVGAKTGLYSIVSMVGRRIKDGKRCDDDTSVEYTQIIASKLDQDKSGTLTSVQKDNLLMKENRIRRLTPIECERLQGLPDNYTEGISDTQRYKCCGNAFNVDVIAHILQKAK
jgi:DNA-cytosine methyltransferase